MFKSIIKRIIVGVGIALALMFIKGNLLMQVNAKSVLTHKAPFENYSYNNTVATFTTNIDSPFFQNAGVGNLYFTFAVNKSTGNSTFPISIIRSVVVFSGNTGYVCNIGSSSLQNSTYGGVSYSAQCPMNIGSSGITKLVFYPSDLQTNDLSIYRWTNEGYYSFETDSSVNITVDTSSTTTAINNQTTTITNNQDQNTQNIINNQNKNRQDLIQKQDELLKGCSYFGSGITWVQGSLSDDTGVNVPSTLRLRSSYVSLNKGTYTVSVSNPDYDIAVYVWDSTLTYWQAQSFTNWTNLPFTFQLRYDNRKVKFVVRKNNNSTILPTEIQDFTIKSCGDNKLDTLDNSINNVNSSINNMNNTITNSNVSSSNDFFEDYIEDFDPNTHGLTRIVLAPIQLISALLDTTCTSLTLPLPFIQQNVSIPCMSSIYNSYFPTFLVVYRLITDGVISYWVCVNVFRKVKAFLDPTDDKVEVFDL